VLLYKNTGNCSLVFNGSLIFAKAAVNTNGFNQASYGLGSWTLLLIGITILSAVASSEGNLVRQDVDIDDSILQHVDFHIGYAFLRIVTSGWHVLSTLLQLVLHALDLMVRESFKSLWKLLEFIHEHASRPLLHTAKVTFWRTWDSPYFSLFLSLGTLLSLHLYHTRAFDVIFPMRWVLSGDVINVTYQFLLFTFPGLVMRFCVQAKDCLFASGTVRIVGEFYDKVYDPILDIEATSPSVALACWLFTCIVRWTRTSVRIKVFAVPALFFYAAGANYAALLQAFGVSYVFWIGLSIVVEQYEFEQRRQAEVAYTSFQEKKGGAVFAPNKFQQTECCICLEDFESPQTKGSTLPCGHQFHEPCIRDWLQSQNRCPICRRAIGGWDRVLEVVF